MNYTTIEVHRAATRLPMMSAEELSQLADDIAANGLLEPIVIYQGKLLDGRNRLKACEIADVEPRFVEVQGELYSPMSYVASKNVHRRHLTISQRAGFAADAVPEFEEEARERQGKRSDLLENIDDETLAPQGAKVESGKAAKMAAKAMQVGERTVERALEVKRKSPELHERVKRGEMTVGEASRKVPRTGHVGGHKSKDVTTSRGKQRAEAHKRRMAEAMAAAKGICEGLANALDIDLIRQVCTQEEIETWATMAKSHAREFRRFAARLRGENGES